MLNAPMPSDETYSLASFLKCGIYLFMNKVYIYFTLNIIYNTSIYYSSICFSLLRRMDLLSH